MTDVAAHQPVRVGLFATYKTLMRWNLAQIGAMMPLIVLVQVLLAVGVVVGFGFIIPQIDTETARFLATGTPTILLLTLGLVIVVQGVVQARNSGTFTYQRALPVPRPLLLASELSVWLIVAIPSVAAAIVVAMLRYDLSFNFDWLLLLGSSALITVTAAAVGYALAVTVPPMLAQLISQALVFFVLLFSPIAFPASQLPVWFQTLHDYLPIRPAADLLRAGIASDVYTASGQDLLVLSLWCVVGVGLSVRALVRRA